MALKKRVYTGLSLIIGIVLVALINNYFITWLVLGIGYIISLKEAKNLFNLEFKAQYFLIGSILWMILLFYPSINALFFITIFYISYALHKNNFEYNDLKLILYPSVSFVFIFMLYADYGMNYLVWLIIIVASTDIGAYFVGKKFGKTKLSKISPNKTIEGALGGIIIASILGIAFTPFYFSFFPEFIVSIFTAIASIYGDLFESMLKRNAGVKDSGNILPGHGGLLDRFDGYMFAVIVMYTLVNIF